MKSKVYLPPQFHLYSVWLHSSADPFRSGSGRFM